MGEWKQYLSENQTKHLEQWKDFLRIPSVSTMSEHRGDMERAAHFLAEHLRGVGLEHVRVMSTAQELENVRTSTAQQQEYMSGFETSQQGRDSTSHPVVYADWLHAQGRPTVLIYGHYDVQPAEPLELWQSPPFEPEIRDGMLYGRGSSDNKGQIFMHLQAMEALLKTAGELPVNIKLVIEGEEEIGSPNLPAFLISHQDMLQADLLVISDTAMLEADQPAICYGLRGLLSFQLDVDGPKQDLASGFYGGAVHNPVHALAQLVASMHTPDGAVAIEGFYDGVNEISEDERQVIASLPQDDAALASHLGVPQLYGEKGYTTLERRWVRPTLEVNGIYGGYQGEGEKTIIPADAHAKISCRLVPNQHPDRIFSMIQAHIERHTPPGVRVTVTQTGAGLPYVTPHDHPAVQLAAQALEQAFEAQVSFIRAGGSIPIVETFATQFGLPIVLIGFALPTANAHGPNEHMSLSHMEKGTRALCRYWELLGQQG
ncbi:dipeptidase [Brevibacillus dissolubilis]|uniref:dipeptidase n=1 Tax=Brevibacillus dissolubilis TaxID=1844116 RepID=UPI0011179AE9|nr:dipeptidase [Brevibacillus dissolubilis]